MNTGLTTSRPPAGAPPTHSACRGEPMPPEARGGSNRLGAVFWAALGFLVRDFRDETSYRLNFIWQLAAPLSGVLSLYFLARLIGPAAGNGGDLSGRSYFAFAVVGIVTLGLLTKALTGFGTSLRQQMMMGTIEPILAAPLSPTLSISMMGTWKITLALLTGLLQLWVAWLLGAPLGPVNPVHLLVALVLVIAAFTGLGLLVAGSVLFISRAQPAVSLLGGLSGLLGGVVYPVAVLPASLARLAQFLPITPAINIFRSVLLTQSQGVSLVGTPGHGAPLAAIAGGDLFTQSALHLGLFALILIPAGLLSIHWGIRYQKKRGLLVTY